MANDNKKEPRENVRAEFKRLDKRSTMLRLASLMRPHWKKMLLAALFVLLINICELLKPLAAAVVIDDFLRGGKPQSGLYSITGMGIGYFVLSMLDGVFTIAQRRTISSVSQSILHKMREKVFKQIEALSVSRLDKYGTGRLITRSTNDVETINEFYQDVFLNLFRDVFLLVGITAVMLTLDLKLALISLIAVPLIFAITFSIKRIIKENFKFIKLVTGKINGFISENLQGIRIIRAFNAEAAKLAEFRELNRQYFKGTITQVCLNTILRPSMELINTLIIALLVAFSYDRIAGGILEVGVLYAFTNYVKQFFNPINDLAEKYTTVQSAFVSCDRIYELLDEECEDREVGFVGDVNGEIEFRDVWFAYSDENWVLKGVSFKLPKGTKAAFVGATGAGKSTIINLITRNYEIQRGEILVDGRNVKAWNLQSLRSGISVVLQDVFLFTGTIRENISMGSSRSDESLAATLKLANAWDFLAMNKNPQISSGAFEDNDEKLGDLTNDVLSTKVSEQGLNFSTGERQLLSFARAIADDPGVLILDEATAHIDTDTELRVREAIESVSKGRTSIYIAHRLSTIRSCDVIFVLKNGQIAEQGTHDRLMSIGGLYAELCRSESETVG